MMQQRFVLWYCSYYFYRRWLFFAYRYIKLIKSYFVLKLAAGGIVQCVVICKVMSSRMYINFCAINHFWPMVFVSTNWFFCQIFSIAFVPLIYFIVRSGIFATPNIFCISIILRHSRFYYFLCCCEHNF